MTEIELPRIVCTKCLSVITVRERMPVPYEDSIVLWIECCKQQKVVSFRGETVKAAQIGRRDLLVQDAMGDMDSGVGEWAREHLARITTTAQRAGWLLRFLEEAGRAGDIPVEERLAMKDALVAAAIALAGPELLERVGIEMLERFQRGTP